tara:strand:+ start:3058 stop:5514 length:2457 start_codon:yes stop_codon:yes gene_type:complete
MAIIYSYPKKQNPTADDLLLISDKDDRNITKTVSIASVQSLTSGVFGTGTAGKLAQWTSSNMIGDYPFEVPSKDEVAPMLSFSDTINNSTYTMLAYVNGARYGSVIKMTIIGTALSTVVSGSFDIMVNHSQDIHIKSLAGDYSEITLRITSNNNEDYSIEAKTNSTSGPPGTPITVDVSIFPLSNEIVTRTTTLPPYTGQVYEHTATEGWRYGGTDGSTESSNLIVDGKIGIGVANPDVMFSVNDSNNDIQMRVGSLTAGISPVIRFQGKNAADTTNYFADISLDAENGKLIFQDPGTSSGSIGQNPSVLDSVGNFGIGTSDPAEALEVSGKIRVTGTGDFLQSYRSPSSQASYILYHDKEGASGAGAPEAYVGYTSNNKDFKIYNAQSLGDVSLFPNSTRAMTLTAPSSQPRIGIGTTSPGAPLVVSSTTTAQRPSTHSSGFKSTSNETITFPTAAGWYRVLEFPAENVTGTGSPGSTRGGSTLKLYVAGGSFGPTNWIINYFKWYQAIPNTLNNLKLEQYGPTSVLRKVRFASIVDPNEATNKIVFLEVYKPATTNVMPCYVFFDKLIGGDDGGTPLFGTAILGTSSTLMQEAAFEPQGTRDVNLAAQYLRLNSLTPGVGGLEPFNVRLVGPNSTTGSPANYAIQFPNTGPGGNNKILESNITGVLSWIDTPAGAGAVTFSGTTANGLVSRGGTTQANVSSFLVEVTQGLEFGSTHSIKTTSNGLELRIGSNSSTQDQESIGFYINGVEEVLIDSDGDFTVGSGTSNPQLRNNGQIRGSYYSADNTAGVTGTLTFPDNNSITRTLVFKNGICTAAS